MYVFGGYSNHDASLGDLCALDIATRRWYFFQYPGSSPSPRYGHAMIVDGTEIIVAGGIRELDIADSKNMSFEEREELSLLYILRTEEIRFQSLQSDGKRVAFVRP